MTHPSPKRNMVPKVILMRSGLVSLTTARPVNTTQPKTTMNSARPLTNVFNKAHSTVRRPINNKTTTKNSNFNQRVNTVSGKNVNTARPKAVVNAARRKAILNAVKGNQFNAVKTLACWVWKPKNKGNPQQDLEEKGVIESGCSRNMTGNMSYLTDFEEIDGGYVAFGDTHNMVAFLEKPAKSEGFEQIMDLLNVHAIKYALMINPTIYTSCIEQFWTTAKVKTINGEAQIHALVDGKKIIITKSTVRRDL
ncbi:hypothetical protein Tco_0445078 [Tanacetum coccineum]